MPLSEKTRGRALLVWIVVFTGLTFYAINGNRERAMEGQEAHDALCTFRADLLRRIESGRLFLKLNPDGIPGISAIDIRRSIVAQDATYKSLRLRNCPNP